ncbi:hypothetical protein [Streptomyces globisporus]|uniref:hypothetical protein n=1 Tax=Streptomyces TaxID=1883 RepID=UPI0004C5B85C
MWPPPSPPCTITASAPQAAAFSACCRAPTDGTAPIGLATISPSPRHASAQAITQCSARVAVAVAGRITLMEGWRPGPTDDRGARRSPVEAGEAVRRLPADAEKPEQVCGAS